MEGDLSKIRIGLNEFTIKDSESRDGIEYLAYIIGNNNVDIAERINDLNDRLDIVETSSYFINYRPNWDETNTSSYSYILNKPNIIQGENNNIIIESQGDDYTSQIQLSPYGELDISSRAIFLNGSTIIPGDNLYERPFFRGNNDEDDPFALLSEAFSGCIKIFGNDESDLDELNDGIYRIQYVWHYEEDGEQITDDIIINQAILIQKSTYNIEGFDLNDYETYDYISTPTQKDQYMYINGIVKHRIYNNHYDEDLGYYVEGWTNWEIINNSSNNVQSNWNENDSTSYSYILNKPNISNLNKILLISYSPISSVAIEPYKLYNFGTVSSSMSISFDTSKEETGYCAEYMFRFTAGNNCNITLPNTVKYNNGERPTTFINSYIYEYSITDNLCVVGEFH